MRNSRSRITIMLGLLLLAVSFGIAHSADWKGTIIDKDGVHQVQNPAEPMLPPLVVDGRLLWSVGGESEADEELLGAIIEVVLDDKKNSYLLDTQLAEIKVFDPDGNYVRTMGRDGEGPGEFHQPTGMFYHPTAGIGVVQPMPARIVMFNHDGEPTADLPIPGESTFMSVSDIKTTGTDLLMSITTTTFNEGKMVIQGKLVCADPAGQVTATLWDRQQERSAAKMVFKDGADELTPVYQAGPGGRVYISPHYDKYEIEVFDTAGNKVQVIRRDYESRRRGDDEINSMKERFKKRMANMPAPIEFEVNPVARDIRTIFTRDNGEIWIGTSRTTYEPETGQFGPYEVFDQDGRYLRQVTVRADYNYERDTVFFLNDRLYVVKEGLSSIRNAFSGLGLGGFADEYIPDELQPPEVLCYQVGYVADR